MDIQQCPQSPTDHHSNDISSLLRQLKHDSKKLLQAYSIFNTTYPPIYIVTFLNLTVDEILSYDPKLFKLSQLILCLRHFYYMLRDHQGYRIKPLFHRQSICYKMYLTVLGIDNEIKSFVDKDIVQNLAKTLQNMESDEEKYKVLKCFKERLNEGFDKDFQQLVLQESVSAVLGSFICDSNRLKILREYAAVTLMALVEYNKDVFVGLVMTRDIVRALVSMASSCSIQVLHILVRHIRVALVEEIEQAGQIPTIINLLNSEDLSIQLAALDCICQIAFCGRKEVIQEMLQEGLIEKLAMLERSEYRGNSIYHRTYSESEVLDSDDENGEFGGCVAKFAGIVEMSEGLNLKEHKELKREILRKVRVASVSEAEAAFLVTEILWSSSLLEIF